MEDYNSLLRLKKTNETYLDIMKKMILSPDNLDNSEKSYLLSFAIVLIHKYEENRTYKSFLEFAYYIILNYSLTYNDYEPLYDFSVNFGFYPIAQAITRDHLLSFSNVEFSNIENLINKKFLQDGIIKTKEQYKIITDLLSSSEQELSFIAPTSYGKSSTIISHIKKFFTGKDRIGIIVPNRSLLLQTARNVRKEKFNTKVITHDEMYVEGQPFIGILTQERALRLLEKNPISFDYLYIDEAQQLLERDARSIRLTRLIKLNKKRNPNTKIVYLSPLIDSTENISFDSNKIYEHKIIYNVKEPAFFLYDDFKQLKYDRFLNDYYPIKEYDTFFTYILDNSLEKNMIFISNPKDMESFSLDFVEKLPTINNVAIDKVISTLKELVNPSFYEINLLHHGIIYLHAKLPDNIKEYLEYSFSSIPEIRFLVANTVILEGINLPIDSLFILSDYKLTQKNLINLIGRVNRLDKVFLVPNSLKKLRPPIHFIENDIFKPANHKFKKKIDKLKSNSMKDNIKNPLLDHFEQPAKSDTSGLQECERILTEDVIFLSNSLLPKDVLKRKLLSLGLGEIYYINDKLCLYLLDNIIKAIDSSTFNDLHFMDKLKSICIDNLEPFIRDKEVKHLSNIEILNYYKRFYALKNIKFKDLILEEVKYFETKQNSSNSLLYIGANGYGEIKDRSFSNAFIDLRNKSTVELVNLAIIIIKLEENFTSYKLNMLFQLMVDYDLLSYDDYNYIIYGSYDSKIIELRKIGFSSDLIMLFKDNNQLKNISIDDNKNIIINNIDFFDFVDSLNDFYKTEIQNLIEL